jgi:hypothetical protein
MEEGEEHDVKQADILRSSLAEEGPSQNRRGMEGFSGQRIQYEKPGRQGGGSDESRQQPSWEDTILFLHGCSLPSDVPMFPHANPRVAILIPFYPDFLELQVFPGVIKKAA